MPAKFSRLLPPLLAILLLAALGCGGLLMDDDEEPPVKNEAGVRALGQQFGEAIQKENYAAAYELLTASRKSEQSLDQFTTTAKQQRQEYLGSFTPAAVETEAYMLFEDELPDWPELPSDIKYESLLGVCTVTWMAAEPDLQEGETEPYSIEVDVVVVDEAGQPRIAHIDWEDNY